MRYSFRQVKNRCILLPLLRLTPPMEGFPSDDFRKILQGSQRMADGQGTQRWTNIAERFNPLSIGCINVTDDRQTDGLATGEQPRF